MQRCWRRALRSRTSLEFWWVACVLVASFINRSNPLLSQNSMIDSVNSPLKLLFISPEKLAKSKRFMAKLEKAYELGRLNLIAVGAKFNFFFVIFIAGYFLDEVHCCSQWGHDFRPDYKFMNILRRQFPKSPILGTINLFNMRMHVYWISEKCISREWLLSATFFQFTMQFS